ncbi:hypothetical protein SteCoe_18949 [Stentor coeruleus]|uniref:C2 domain-containing protein n=1 Tax=Stentor coeruleus TaxID=5963 RepID=A0A1R2BV89_9CILI|nr:hypothetical protein SteCoe_18949 [Stentor coeruleus]
MTHPADLYPCIVLRLKIFDGILERNVAKFGSMSPYLEVQWNNEKWYSKIASNNHLTPIWNEYHIFESSDPSPLTIKVLHNSLIFTSQEIGFCIISVDELFKGKINETLELLYESKTIGYIRISANMYEEKRSELSTHNTSYAANDLKEEYAKKLYELELEKEELEFYKRKYKKKLEKLNQEKRGYKNKVTEFVRKTTPNHTEEGSDDNTESNINHYILYSQPDEIIKEECYDENNRNIFKDDKEISLHLKNQLTFDMTRIKCEGFRNIRKKGFTQTCGKINEMCLCLEGKKKIQDDERMANKKNISLFSLQSIKEWEDGKEDKRKCLERKDDENDKELLELRYEGFNQFVSPQRDTVHKSTDYDRNARLQDN